MNVELSRTANEIPTQDKEPCPPAESDTTSRQHDIQSEAELVESIGMCIESFSTHENKRRTRSIRGGEWPMASILREPDVLGPIADSDGVAAIARTVDRFLRLTRSLSRARAAQRVQSDEH